MKKKYNPFKIARNAFILIFFASFCVIHWVPQEPWQIGTVFALSQLLVISLSFVSELFIGEWESEHVQEWAKHHCKIRDFEWNKNNGVYVLASRGSIESARKEFYQQVERGEKKSSDWIIFFPKEVWLFYDASKPELERVVHTGNSDLFFRLQKVIAVEYAQKHSCPFDFKNTRNDDWVQEIVPKNRSLFIPFSGGEKVMPTAEQEKIYDKKIPLPEELAKLLEA